MQVPMPPQEWSPSQTPSPMASPPPLPMQIPGTPVPQRRPRFSLRQRLLLIALIPVVIAAALGAAATLPPDVEMTNMQVVSGPCTTSANGTGMLVHLAFTATNRGLLGARVSYAVYAQANFTSGAALADQGILLVRGRANVTQTSNFATPGCANDTFMVVPYAVEIA